MRFTVASSVLFLPASTVYPELSWRVKSDLFDFPGWPIQAELSLLFCHSCLVRSAVLAFSVIMSQFPVALSRFSCPSCPRYPDLPVQSWLVLSWVPVAAVLSQLSCPCSGHHGFSILSRMTFRADLSRRICPGCPVLGILHLLSSKGCYYTVDLSRLACPCSQVLANLFFLSYPGCLVPRLSSRLSCPFLSLC